MSYKKVFTRVMHWAVILLLVFALSGCSSVDTPESESLPTVIYLGSSQSDKYHLESCVWAEKILPSNLVVFRSRDEAESNGYIPCKVCEP